MGAQTRNRLWLGSAPDTSACIRAGKKKGAEDRPFLIRRKPSRRVVHLELDGGRVHAEARDLVHLERDVRVDHVVGEDAATGKERAILVEVLERPDERRARWRQRSCLLRFGVVRGL